MNKRLEVIVAGGVAQDGALLERIARLAGGYFVTQGSGGWIDDDDHHLAEQASMVVVYARAESTLNGVIRAVLNTARIRGEEYVMIDGETVATGVRKGSA